MGKSLDLGKLAPDESRSNPMIVAMQYETCPINEICFYVAVGFGSIGKQCEHFNFTEEEGECLWNPLQGGLGVPGR